MASFKRGGICWYKFYFAGQEIRESSKSTSNTVAKAAEQQRRRELEAGFHNLKEVRQQRIRRLNEVVDEYLVGYRLRYRSATFAKYALGHVSRLLGAEMIVDIDEAAVLRYHDIAASYARVGTKSVLMTAVVGGKVLSMVEGVRLTMTGAGFVTVMSLPFDVPEVTLPLGT